MNNPATTAKRPARKSTAPTPKTSAKSTGKKTSAKLAAVAAPAEPQPSSIADAEAAKLVELRTAAVDAQLDLERYVRKLVAGGAKPAHVAKAAGIAGSSVQNYIKREMRGQPL